jgi:hypothetical protein
MRPQLKAPPAQAVCIRLAEEAVLPGAAQWHG